MKRFLAYTVLCLGLLLSLQGGGATSLAQDASPVAASGSMVMPPDSVVDGLTINELAARYTAWLYSFPNTLDPAMDVLGERCGVGQSGPVFFLAGVYQMEEEPAEPACTVAAGTQLFFTPLSGSCTTIEEPPFYGGNEVELRSCSEELFATPADLRVSINGVDVPDLVAHRAQSSLFTFALPADNVYGVEPGVIAGVADGYWVLTQPLSPGEYKIRFGGGLPAMEVPYGEVIYHVTVAEPVGLDSAMEESEATPVG